MCSAQAYVRFVPIADIDWSLWHVRFGPIATDAPQQTASLFDHLVGERENAGRKIETECLGSLEIDD
jgi:hypothetical protein